MITETGKNLSILIVTETSRDWQTFATWYSFYKNLPDAKVAIVCHRNNLTPFEYFQWTKRLNIPTMHRWPFTYDEEGVNWLAAVNAGINRGALGESILVVRPLVMALGILDPKVLERINQTDQWINEDVWFLRNPDIKTLINEWCLDDKALENSPDNICYEAKEKDLPACFVSYKKGCGRWIDTSTGCPFSSAAGLASTEMTANERKIIELWQTMVPLYNAVA